MKERMVFAGRFAAPMAAIVVIGLVAGSVAWAGAAGGSGAAVVGVQDEDGERVRVRREVRKELERAVCRRLHRTREFGERIRERMRDDVRSHLRRRWMPDRGRLAFFGPDHGDGFLLAFADELELTDEQAEQIEEIRDRHRREAIERRADAEVAKLDLHDLKEDPEADLAAVEAKMRELADLRIEGELSRFRMHRRIRDLLTEEQRQELEGLRRGPRRLFFGSGPGHDWDGPPRPFHWRFREGCEEDDR